ncbi:Glycerol-3-phosphate dehydrogenase, mitochondrial [Collichthys lucidus]|uniref:glycerol-3-phosphate dehydrogenase n=1 Tax=Collichthys lucidus TaxID=240159 RepID=A0A4V6AM78_COLLU|nr:Glycerol-3-phosphate dehydrogenase, mitochondrial [Collichthys lucidus]
MSSHPVALPRSRREFNGVHGGGGAADSHDAVTNNLKTALVKRDDFSSGTSSRSTKLIHGGVRYLQKAIMKLDYKQVGPHSLPFPEKLSAFPVQEMGEERMGSRKGAGAGATLRPKGHCGFKCAPCVARAAIALMQRQHNDARMNLAIALTAARYGAAIANYTEVVHLLKRADPQTGKERVYGAHCRDVITGQEFDVRAKCVINATGPFTDALRKMDDQKNPDICQPSAGVHIVILGYYSADRSLIMGCPFNQPGLLVPSPPQQTKVLTNTELLDPVTSSPYWERMPKYTHTEQDIVVQENINFILMEVNDCPAASAAT